MSDMGDAAVGVGDAGRGDDGGEGAVGGDTGAGGDVRGESGTIDAGGGDDGGEGAVGGNTEAGTIRSSSCSDDSNSAHAAQCQSISMSSLTAAR